jgi:sterol desaturase/sphingolipid hydroxylase (fatty acid hydroxylase superfamily)
MDAFIAFFEDIPTSYRTAILVGGFMLFWLLEGAVPLFRFEFRRGAHALVNLLFWSFTLAINFGFAFLIVGSADFTKAHRTGLLYLVELPAWAHVLAGLLLLDLVSAWLIHWIEHRVRWMWKFHLVHHSDRQVDVTTGLRHHPGEALFRAAFTVLAILVAGVPVAVVMLYQTLSALFAQLTHANVRVPDRLDRVLSWVFVTPNMHKVHHHFVQPLTDTNYGNIFAVWDRLFGTFAYAPANRLTYGIDTHMGSGEDSRVGGLLAIPFRPYRPPTGAKFADAREGPADPAEAG